MARRGLQRGRDRLAREHGTTGALVLLLMIYVYPLKMMSRGIVDMM